MEKTISVNVTLHGWLIKYFSYNSSRIMQLPQSSRVSDLVELISMPSEAYIVKVNGKKVSKEKELAEADEVHFYPLVVGG